MNILCIDTATEFGTVALTDDDGSCVAVQWRSEGRHDENLLAHVESALSKGGSSREQLDAIGVVVGPGGFTSLRVGLATAKGLALGLDLPIVGVSSLRVMARSLQGPPDAVRVPVLRSYRGEVFAAAYRLHDDGLEELVEPQAGARDEVLGKIEAAFRGQVISISGEGRVVTPEALSAEIRHVLRARGPSELEALEPAYLRPSDAKLPAEPLSTEHADKS